MALAHANPFYNESGRITGAANVLVDISERKLFITELEQAKSYAEQASTAKSTFLSNMSHELRTPLNAILGFSQVLASDTFPVTPEKRKDFTVHIVKAGKHLLALINETLDLAKVESGIRNAFGLSHPSVKQA